MEIREKLTAQMYFRMAGVAKRIEVQIGDALAIVKKTPGMLDGDFIDVDKNQYPAALHAVRPKLPRGGLLITDNTICLQGGASSTGRQEGHEGRAGIQPNGVCVEELYPVLIPPARRPDYLPQELGKPVATAGTGTTKQIVRRNMPYRSGRTLGYRMRSRLPLWHRFRG